MEPLPGNENESYFIRGETGCATWIVFYFHPKTVYINIHIFSITRMSKFMSKFKRILRNLFLVIRALLLFVVTYKTLTNVLCISKQNFILLCKKNSRGEKSDRQIAQRWVAGFKVPEASLQRRIIVYRADTNHIGTHSLTFWTLC